MYSKVSDGSSLGMPYVTVLDPTYEAPRPTVAETLSSIISDLNDAEPLIGSEIQNLGLPKMVLTHYSQGFIFTTKIMLLLLLPQIKSQLKLRHVQHFHKFGLTHLLMVILNSTRMRLSMILV